MSFVAVKVMEVPFLFFLLFLLVCDMEALKIVS